MDVDGEGRGEVEVEGKKKLLHRGFEENGNGPCLHLLGGGFPLFLAPD